MRRRSIRVVIMSVQSLAEGRIAPGAPPGRGAPVEPAGDRPAGTIAFSSLAPRGYDLYIFEVASRRTRRLTDHPALDFNAAFAPDGRSLAFISTRDGNHESGDESSSDRGEVPAVPRPSWDGSGDSLDSCAGHGWRRSA